MGVKKRSGDHIRFIIYLIVIVLINMAGMTLFFRIDLTSNKSYSISEASKEVVSTLSEPLTISVFFTKNLSAPYNNTEKYLRDTLEEYSIYANDYFNYRFYDVSPEDGGIQQDTITNRELARSYGIQPVQIQHIENDELKFKNAYMGLVLIHGDITEQIPAIASTDRLEYQLTTAIQKLNNKISALLRLSDKIGVKLFLSSSLETVAPYMGLENLPELPNQIENIVKELNTKSYGKLEFQHLDPSKERRLEGELERYDILSLEWPDIPKENIESGKGAIGLIMEYGDKMTVIPIMKVFRLPIVGIHYELTDQDEMKEIINENLESLIDINEDLGYLADHGSLNSGGGSADLQGIQDQESLSNFNTLVSQTYSIREIRLSEEDIPESLNCLIIPGPEENFTDYELFQIDQFLMRGKTLAIFLDAMIADESGSGQSFTGSELYVPLNTGIEKLLEHYGISMKRSFVMDENCYKQQLSENFGGGEMDIYFIPFIMDRFIDKDLPFMNNIKGLAVSRISPLEVNLENIKEKGLKANRLFASSEKSWEMKEPINLNPMYIKPPESNSEFNSMPLAYILEGEFPSYFADKPIPEKELKKDGDAEEIYSQGSSGDISDEATLSRIKSEGTFLSKGKPGKIFLMSSSEILKDYILDSEGTSSNAIFILNLIDYLNNREATAVMRGKESSYNPLVTLSGGTKAFLKYFNILGLPVLVVLFGLFFWFRRHQRKKFIRAMFMK
ncbi:Gldg family protein [Deltaproteobacteria bacterium]|nr:Gldg family protein [Deltaproteobacteria bacterium]